MNFTPEYFNGEIRDGFYVQPLMKRVWAAQMEVLEEVERICTKYGLKYFAVYGTLLGAVRHKGFIPWDDDLDISMLREDYDKFAEIIQQELPEDWRTFDCRDEGFHTRLIRVINAHGSRLDSEFLDRFHGCPFAIGIDIIPWDHIPDNKNDEKKMFDLITMLDTMAVNWDNYKTDKNDIETLLRNLETTTGYHFDRAKPLSSQLLHCADRIAAMYREQKTKYVAVAADLPSQPENRLPISCFDKIIRLPFECMTIPVIEDYDSMLKKYYGEDYMQPQIKYDTHSYPFFVNKLHTLQDFFTEKNMAFPERFHIFVPKCGNPLVSIIIPCCNAGKYIERCLQSLLCQSIGASNLQIICIDNASSSDITDKLKKWEKRLGDILTIISCEETIDCETAKAIGIEYSSADYITFMEPDDWAEIDWLETLYRPLETEELDISMCSFQKDFSDTLSYFDKQERKNNGQFLNINSIEKRKTFLRLHLLGDKYHGKLIRKELLTKNKIYMCEQYTLKNSEYTSLLYFYTEKIYIQNINLYHQYVRADSASSADTCTILWGKKCAEWLTCQERGFFNDYQDELEYIFLHYAYLEFLKQLATEMQPSYSLFLSAKADTLAFIPQYKQNKYYEESFNEFQKILLETLTIHIDQSEFEQIIKIVKSYL